MLDVGFGGCVFRMSVFENCVFDFRFGVCKFELSICDVVVGISNLSFLVLSFEFVSLYFGF